jgi:O-antigen biosynthesis protein
MGLSVCFVLGAMGPSGGVRVITEHARALAREHGMDVSLAVWSADGGDAHGVPVMSVADARERTYDVAIATWWRTAYALFDVPARRHVYFVQQFDERVYRSGDVERFGAALTHDLPVAFLSEAAWIVEQLAELRPEAPCFHVPNGIDKRLFAAPERPAGHDGALRVLVEGSPHLWYKGVAEALAVLARTTQPIATTLVTPEPPDDATRLGFGRVLGPLEHSAMPSLYGETDVLLKLSRVEGVFTPPLEAFHLGATCVVWPVTGHDEYVEHGRNGVVADFDDVAGTAHWLDQLARDRALLGRLRRGALETAAAWPAWDAATATLAAALHEIVDADPPAAGAGASQLLADLDAAMEEQRRAQRRLVREAQSLERALAALEATRTFRARARTRRLLASLRR